MAAAQERLVEDFNDGDRLFDQATPPLEQNAPTVAVMGDIQVLAFEGILNHVRNRRTADPAAARNGRWCDGSPARAATSGRRW